jgi:hypothetical protein
MLIYEAGVVDSAFDSYCFEPRILEISVDEITA